MRSRMLVELETGSHLNNGALFALFGVMPSRETISIRVFSNKTPCTGEVN